MNMKTLAIALIAIIAIAAVVAGVGMMNQDDPLEGVEDARGRTVEIPDTIDHILCLNCCSLELLSYFDSFGKICAVDVKDADNPGKTYYQINKTFIQSLPTVAEDPESVKALDVRPSLIITSTIDVKTLDDFQTKVGIPVFAINADVEFGNETWFDQISTLGKVLGEEQRSKQLVNGIRSILEDISCDESGLHGYACGMMFYGAGSDRFLRSSGDYLPFTFAGIENIVPHSSTGVGGQPYDIDAELITSLSTEIDVILIDGSAVSSTVSDIRAFLEENPAVAEKSAFVDGEIFSTMTYKIWGTQYDAVLLNCAFASSLVHDGMDFEKTADGIIGLLYGDDIALEDILEYQPDAFSQITLENRI